MNPFALLSLSSLSLAPLSLASLSLASLSLSSLSLAPLSLLHPGLARAVVALVLGTSAVASPTAPMTTPGTTRLATAMASAMTSLTAPPTASPGAAARRTWVWPLDPEPAVLRPFEQPPQPWAAGNRGVDLAAAAGQWVRAPAAGTVTFAGVVAGKAVLVVTHVGGLRSSFEPVAALVPIGTVVTEAEPVGVVTAGVASCEPTGGCLHWGVRRGRTYLDPLALLGRGSVVLVPASG